MQTVTVQKHLCNLHTHTDSGIHSNCERGERCVNANAKGDEGYTERREEVKKTQNENKTEPKK